ncbi:DUF5994 family protein [Streptomyces sp. Edi4]|uniref:DUF5994 family protein n=1 Tax=Streptomyces sp. Edi4 TaxID=3162527 RepID=UPI00330675DC
MRGRRTGPTSHRIPKRGRARPVLRRPAWDEIPTRLVIDDRVVHLGSFPVGDDTVLITRGHNDHFALLMVPARASVEAARTAMARAVRADNTARAAHLLLTTRPPPGKSPLPDARQAAPANRDQSSSPADGLQGSGQSGTGRPSTTSRATSAILR